MGSWICLGGLKNDTTAPTTPVISATVASSTEIDITLTAASTDAGGLRQYVLERSPNGSTSWTTLATGLSIFPYADTGLTSSTTYYYRCTASDFAANASVSSTVNATTTTSGADSFGITTYAVQSLITGINNGFDVLDNTSGAATTAFSSDGTGNFARITWPISGGNCGIGWDVVDTTKKQLYIRYEYRRSVAAHSKRLKIFGLGYPANYSNITLAVDYSGVAQAVSYSDAAGSGGHDIDIQFFLGSFPTMTGGAPGFSRTPHPTKNTDVATNESSSNVWQREEIFWKQNSDGVNDGELIWWLDGTRILWLSDMYNCRTGGQGFKRVSFGDFIQSNAAAVSEDFRLASISYERPIGRGV